MSPPVQTQPLQAQPVHSPPVHSPLAPPHQPPVAVRRAEGRPPIIAKPVAQAAAQPAAGGWRPDAGAAPAAYPTRRGMPGWAKGLIACVLLVLLVGGALIGGLEAMRWSGGRVRSFTDPSLPMAPTVMKAVDRVVAPHPEFDGQIGVVISYNRSGGIDFVIANQFQAELTRELAGMRGSVRGETIRYSYRVRKGTP